MSLSLIITLIVLFVEFDGKHSKNISTSTSTKRTVSVTTIWGGTREVKKNNTSVTDNVSGVRAAAVVDIQPLLLPLIVCVIM